MLIQDMLEEAGHEVVHALNGAQALQAAARSDRPFDMLMTDLRMPGISGEELARRLRQQQPRLPVLVLTGSPPAGGLAGLAVGQGPAALLVKPVRPTEMRRAVDRLMSVAGLRNAVVASRQR